MKSFFFVLILVVLVLPLLGYLPKVSYETITTYEDHGVFWLFVHDCGYSFAA